MSSFICKRDTLNAIAFAADGGVEHHHRQGPVVKVTDDPREYIRQLVDHNTSAYNYRYPHMTVTPVYYTFISGKTYHPAECVKACNCWLYQCAESDALMNHPLFKEVEMIARSLAVDIVCTLPEYKNFHWGD